MRSCANNAGEIGQSAFAFLQNMSEILAPAASSGKQFTVILYAFRDSCRFINTIARLADGTSSLSKSDNAAQRS
jgi:hypothetical protein